MTVKKKKAVKNTKPAGANKVSKAKAPAPEVATAKYSDDSDAMEKLEGEIVEILADGKQEPEIHKTSFEAQILCPECNTVLAQTYLRQNKRYYICNNQRCDLFESKFKLPQIEIERVVED